MKNKLLLLLLTFSAIPFFGQESVAEPTKEQLLLHLNVTKIEIQDLLNVILRDYQQAKDENPDVFLFFENIFNEFCRSDQINIMINQVITSTFNIICNHLQSGQDAARLWYEQDYMQWSGRDTNILMTMEKAAKDLEDTYKKHLDMYQKRNKHTHENLNFNCREYDIAQQTIVSIIGCKILLEKIEAKIKELEAQL